METALRPRQVLYRWLTKVLYNQHSVCECVNRMTHSLYYCILYISDIVRRQSQSHILEMGMEMLMIGMTWKPSVTHMSLAVMLFEENICLPGNSPSWPHSIAVKSPFQNAELGSLLDVQRLENAVWRLWPREQRWGKFQHGVRLWNPLLYNFSLYGETYKIYVNL